LTLAPTFKNLVITGDSISQCCLNFVGFVYESMSLQIDEVACMKMREGMSYKPNSMWRIDVMENG
jgi:hypothetical protein